MVRVRVGVRVSCDNKQLRTNDDDAATLSITTT